MESGLGLIPLILRDIDDSILALDRRGHIAYMNPQCRALLGGLYEKQRNIWGLLIILYVLGQAVCCPGFLS